MKCLVNLFSDAQLNFQEWHHARKYSCSVAGVAKLWKTKKLGFHVEILNFIYKVEIFSILIME